MTDLQLAELHLRTLYVHDGRNRLVSETVSEGRQAPRFTLVRTAQGCLARVRRDVPAATAATLLDLAASEPPLPQVHGPMHAARYAELLAATRVGGGPGYAFPDDLAAPESPVRITAANADLLEPRFAAMADELRRGVVPAEPCFAAFVDDEPAAICCSARWVDGAAQAGVETRFRYRGRGLAGLVSAAWAAAVRETGRTPIYSTSDDNLASQSVARKLRLHQFARDFTVA